MTFSGAGARARPRCHRPAATAGVIAVRLSMPTAAKTTAFGWCISFPAFTCPAGRSRGALPDIIRQAARQVDRAAETRKRVDVDGEKSVAGPHEVDPVEFEP